MKIVLLCLISLIACVFSQNIPFNFEKPYRYYKSLLDSQPIENFVHIDVDENGPYLRATKLTSQLAPMFCLSKELVINDCQFYPFKDEIFNVIQEIFKSLPQKSYFLKKLYLLAYQILYFKFGDYNRAKSYYTRKKKIQMSSAFLIKPPLVVKEYIEQLFEYVPDSIYNFTEDNIDLVKRLGFKNDAYNILMKVYNKVLSYSLHHIDSEAEVIELNNLGNFDLICWESR
jgi:hypothetical protein